MSRVKWSDDGPGGGEGVHLDDLFTIDTVSCPECVGTSLTTDETKAMIYYCDDSLCDSKEEADSSIIFWTLQSGEMVIRLLRQSQGDCTF